MSKQDRQGVRTAPELEQKYSFGKRFAEILGIATDARDKVDSVESTLRNEIAEKSTSITRDTEQIVLAAVAETYATTEDVGELRNYCETEFETTAGKISMNFDEASERFETVEGDVQKVHEDLQKHFEFTANGLTIKAGENEMKLRLDNDTISFYKGEIDEDDLEKNRFGWWDGVDFHTGNVIVELNERAQFGNYAFVPRSNGSLDFLKVGE
jgi:uncharacterized cupin superfamily protein